MYLIDKVVRTKALRGPIGVDNSEVIGLEQEKELKKRDKYLRGLAEGYGEEGDGEEMDDTDAFLQAQENKQNEKLLKRLYKAAKDDLDAHGDPQSDSSP